MDTRAILLALTTLISLAQRYRRENSGAQRANASLTREELEEYQRIDARLRELQEVYAEILPARDSEGNCPVCGQRRS